MSGFEDSFNASGRRKGRNKKAITIAKKVAENGANPLALPTQLAHAAQKGSISKQVDETWQIDGFDNADGAGKKKTLTTAQGAMIGFTALIITAGLAFVITRMSTKKAK